MEFRMLGDLQAWHDGQRVPLGGHRQRCVLAVLLLTPGQVAPMQRIVERSWPADSPDTATALVTSYVSRLRKTLAATDGQVHLVSRRPGYLAQVDPGSIDVHKFAHLLRLARRDREGLDPEGAARYLYQALDLWTGTPLADLDSPWLQDQRARIERMRLDAVEILAEIELDAGHADRLLGPVRDLAEANPQREHLAVLAIRALSAVGEPSQAVDLAAHTIRALREQGLDPGAALRQAQQDALSPSPRQSAHQRNFAGRAQLPPDTPVFTGRRRELESVSALLSNGRLAGDVALCTVDGPAGVGKTAFAIRAAHNLASNFPDGQMFIDLRGFTPGMDPIRPVVALERLLRALGMVPHHIPLDLDERAAVYRDRLADTRTLIVLDNAANEAQIRPLLPGAPGCLVLATSRRCLTGLDDAHVIRLAALPDGDASSLFTTIAGHGRVQPGDAALAETIALCGNIPLAIRIAAARLRNRPAWRVDYLAERLRDQAQRLAQFDDGERSLVAALAVSYDHLTAEEQGFFRHLGMHPGTDIDLYAAAALAGIGLETADVLLETLVDHNLLAQPATGRYQLHDLVRLYARQRADDETPAARECALRRLLDYFLRAVTTADQHLAHQALLQPAYPAGGAGPQAGVGDGDGDAVEGEDGSEGGLGARCGNTPLMHPALASDVRAAAWMETERANLTALVEHASEVGLSDFAIAFPLAMHSALRIHGHWTLSRRLQEVALATARKTGNHHAEAHALYRIGDIQMVTNHYSRAATTFSEALALYQQLGDRLGASNTYTARGQVHRSTAHFRKAEQDLRNALRLCREIGSQFGQANALTALGAVQKLTGQYGEAQENLREALTLYARHGRLYGQAEALTYLGEVQERTGQFAEAAETLERARDLYRRLGDRLGQAVALTSLGEVQNLTKQYSLAQDDLRAAMELHRQLGNRLGQAQVLTTLSAVQFEMEQFAEALDAVETAIVLFEQMGDRLSQADALSALANIRHAMGSHQEAAENHRRALELYQQVEYDL